MGSLDLADVFSIRSGWRDLTRRPAFHEPVVDGVRAIAVLWVLLFHAWFFQNPMLLAPSGVEQGLDTHGGVATSPWMAWLREGHYGVDLFFVISGFLIGSILLRELDRSDGIDFKRFYWRRAMRLMPVYVVAGLLGLFFLQGKNFENAWANLLYVNNFLPVDEQYMGWCWSLAIEEQFYLVVPVLLLFTARGRKRWLPKALAVLALGWIIRGGLLAYYGFQIEWGDDFNTRFSLMYDNFYTRYGGLLLGVIAAYLHTRHTERMVRFFNERRLLSAALTLLALVVFVFIGGVQRDYVGELDGLAMYVHYGVERDLLGAAVAFLILSALHGRSLISLGVRGFLSWRAFYPLAQLSYSSYLMHEMLMIWVFPRTTEALRASIGDGPAFVANAALTVVASFVFAALLYITIERPSMRLRRWEPFAGSDRRSPAVSAVRAS